MASTTVAQAHADEEIAKHTAAICALRTQGDAPPLIDRLPAETLADVFIHCAKDYYNEGSGRSSILTPTWINVSYVCRHWRDVALNCPDLWTYLFIASPRWMNESLARSKQASLKLHVSSVRFTTRWEQYFMEQVMVHVERIEEIRLNIRMKRGIDEFFSRFSSRAPRLRILEIKASFIASGSEWSSVLFDGDTPALRTLKFKNCPVPWYSFRLSGLTTLSLQDVPGRVRQDISELLATLRSVQGLKCLYLDRAVSNAADFLSSAEFLTFQKVNLPHLSRLLIAAPLSTVITLLSCMDFPLETELRLECSDPSLDDSSSDSESASEDDSPSLDEYTILSSLLRQRFTSTGQAPSRMAIRSLVVDCHERNMTRLGFSTSQCDCDSFYSVSEEWGVNIPLRILVDSGRLTVMSDICCSIPLTHVQSVHVIKPPSSRDVWRKIMRHLPNLRYIKLSNGTMPDLASLLSVSNLTVSKGMDAEQGSDWILAPALEELELYDIFLSRTPRGFKTWRVADAQSLYDALSTRKNTQGRLTMTQCHLTGEWDRLFDLVGRWGDGHFHIVEKRECDSDTSWSTTSEIER